MFREEYNLLGWKYASLKFPKTYVRTFPYVTSLSKKEKKPLLWIKQIHQICQFLLTKTGNTVFNGLQISIEYNFMQEFMQLKVWKKCFYWEDSKKKKRIVKQKVGLGTEKIDKWFWWVMYKVYSTIRAFG